VTPVKKYVEAKVVSGGLRAEIEARPAGSLSVDPSEGIQTTPDPTVVVHLLSDPRTDITYDNLISFTAEVSQIVAEERDGEEPQHG
jgi:hypothetical protein